MIRGHERGQVLPLFALMLIVIMGFAALAIDVSGVYAARRAYRSIADAAALAGAQDLYQTGTRRLDPGTYANARTRALQAVRTKLGGTLTCSTSGSTSTCSLTSGDAVYTVKAKAPIGSGCADCDPVRSVAVSLSRPKYPLAFAAVLGFRTFDVGVKSVAGMRVRKAYTIVTLRPPDSRNNNENEAIKFGGTSTKVVVREGDVASNGNMTYNGGNEQLTLDADYDFDYYDPYTVGRRWETVNGIVPAGNALAAPIVEPDYAVPVKPSNGWGPQPITTAAGDTACLAEATYLKRDGSNYRSYFTDIPTTDILCWQPGTYAGGPTISGSQVAILAPGIYFFPDGLDVKGGLIGGYRPGVDGVALVFGRGGQFKNSTDTSFAGDLVSLNAGSRPLESTSGTGTEAKPARYPNSNVFGNAFRNKLVQTDDGKPLTVMVQGNGSCRVVAHASCSPSDVIRLTGGATVYLAGVVYAPEDNTHVSGKSGGIGIIGQMWTWTLTYVGNSTIYQGGADKARPGPLRLDAACTVGGTPCPTF